jgi:hypothetical protein
MPRPRPAGSGRRVLRRCLMNRGPNSLIDATTADMTGKPVVNICIGGSGVFREQRRRGHDHAHLAISALRHLLLDPRKLRRMPPVGCKPFNRGDAAAGHRGDSRGAGARGLAVHVYGAGATEGHPAAEFRSRQSERIAKHSEQRRIGAHFDTMRFAIYGD